MDWEWVLYKFCNGSCLVLVFMDLVVCGFDILEVEYIIYYYLLVNEEVFIYCNGCIVCWDVMGIFYLILNLEEYVLDYIFLEFEIFDLLENVYCLVKF